MTKRQAGARSCRALEAGMQNFPSIKQPEEEEVLGPEWKSCLISWERQSSWGNLSLPPQKSGLLVCSLPQGKAPQCTC